MIAAVEAMLAGLPGEAEGYLSPALAQGRPLDAITEVCALCGPAVPELMREIAEAMELPLRGDETGEELGKLTDGARNSLNNFIEALAVMIVTSCVIPILVLLFFIWLAKTILGVRVEVPVGAFHPRASKRLKS